MKKIKIGIIGGAGYTGGELIRLLLNHPDAVISFVHSKHYAGKRLSDVHTDLIGETEIVFSDAFSDADLLFLCVAHGEAKSLLENEPGLKDSKIIDLSQDHRIGKFVYGLPELNREKICSSEHIANPGCFATAIQLALLPLASAGLLKDEIHISATTGSTGAGQSLSASSHFSWRQNNLSAYKSFTHQHLEEIGQTLRQVLETVPAISFVPMRGSFTRGIFGTAYTGCSLEQEEITTLFRNYYDQHPFTYVSGKPVDLKQVVNTNKCLLSIEKHDKKVLISFCIDNLLKGASGQAVQNMNLMFGLEETRGLKLKASYF